MASRNTKISSPTNPPLLFISHTTGRSSEFSLVFASWFETSPLAGSIGIWHSANHESLSVGTYAHQRIVGTSVESKYCISIVTEENITEPWINFEAGLFFAKESAVSDLKPIVTILCGRLKYQDIPANHPLQPIYSTRADSKSSLQNLLKAIRGFSNANVKDSAIEKFIGSSTTEELISEHNRIFSDYSNKMIDAKRGLAF